ncbi:hypothetical protein RAS1_18120 [Phycisphaerae bacterium RAS1]|nr:hypothetical protein RAS1_18120 [Phycisphaerae bacterium RAS1]
MSAPATKFWIGPSGWSYADWSGVFYPASPPRGFKPLAFIARYFNAVEVNSTFYRIPAASVTAAWPKLTPPDFRFALKLTQSFTHQRSAFPEASEADAFHACAAPLRDAGKLGPLLIQFPWSFRYSPAAADWLARLAETFADYDRFIEVRHTSWAQPEALDAIRRSGGYCNIDQPLLNHCLGPTPHVFGERAYVRLHGRNAATWFAEGLPAFERYNYLYSEAEIREWVARLNSMADRAREVYVFTNNHYRGQGPANALDIRAMLEGRPVDVPDELLRAYPGLKSRANPARQPGLFE